jgi:hypothetical protein
MSTLSTRKQGLALSSGIFGFVFLVGYFSDMILIRHPRWLLADDLILAAIAGLLVYLYERERSRLLTEKLRVIRDMNSFVRNELQIVYASLANPCGPHVDKIERSVERIDWALRELLPGTQMLEAPGETQLDLDSKDKARRSA